MTAEDMHINFKLGVDKSDTVSTPDFEPEEVDTWLNIAQERIIKQRYSGMNPTGNSLEETQKRTDDLREVIMNATITPGTSTASSKPHALFFSLPNTAPQDVYWFAINEETNIIYQDCNSSIAETIEKNVYYLVTGTIVYNETTYTDTYFLGVVGHSTYTGTGTIMSASSKRVEVKPIQHDDYNHIIKDPFNKPYHNQVMRLMFQDKAELIGTSTVVPSIYHLRYIRKPLAILLDLNTPSNTVNCELSDHLHQEIVELAVSMALENIESVRYQTNLNELSKQE